MGEESPKPASTPTGAVFLSYASQDAEAAQCICASVIMPRLQAGAHPKPARDDSRQRRSGDISQPVDRAAA